MSDIRRVTAAERVLVYLEQFPWKSHKEAMSELQMPPATYWKALKAARKEKKDEFISALSLYPVPPDLVKSIMPPAVHQFAHLAIILEDYKNEEIVHPYGRTKAEIIEASRNYIRDKQIDIMNNLLNVLGLYSIYVGDTSAFRNYFGKKTPPEFEWLPHTKDENK